jgi:hypothetical protein
VLMRKLMDARPLKPDSNGEAIYRGDTKIVSLLVAFLSVPFAAFSAVEGIQIGQSAKSPRSSKEFHRLGTTKAARWARRFGVGPVSAFVTHEAVLANASKTRPPLILGGSINRGWLEA